CTDQQNSARWRSISRECRCASVQIVRDLAGAAPGRAAPLAPRTVTPARRARRPALAFEPLTAFAGLQEAAPAGRAGVEITVSFLGGRCALAAQLLHTRTDRCKIVGGAGSSHVSSSSLAEPR